jgi:hypothetical protein
MPRATSSFYTVFGLHRWSSLGKEAKTLLQRLSALLAAKWGKIYSRVCGYVNARMSIVIVRATHLCLRGSRIPTRRTPQASASSAISPAHVALAIPASRQDCARKFYDLALTDATSPPSRGWTS